MGIHALRRRGWSISAIARHVGRDRKTVRAYLERKRQVGQLAPAGEDSLASFVDYAQIAKHFGLRVRPCPPRRGHRKGVVEKANHTAAQRWWRSLPDEVTAAAAQASLDEFCEQVNDQLKRLDPDGNRCTVVGLGAAEPLRPVPESLRSRSRR